MNNTMDINDKFSNKKLIIYGTGQIAERFLCEYNDTLNVVCCLDRSKRDGFFCDIPIKTWEEIDEETADCLVIASSYKFLNEIYCRIIYDCDRNHLEVYDNHGVNLRDMYRYEYIPYNVLPLLKSDRKDLLKREIDAHEAISFDLFDTLVMRKVMEPEDVFKWIVRKLDDSCPVKETFYFLRKNCESKVNAVIKGVDEIYRQIEREAGLKQHELDYICELEKIVEKELIVPRLGMKEIFDYAISKAKKVNIISDMYLDTATLKQILETFGFCGYANIFVSCERGTSKEEKLFDVYKEEVKADSYLHIGDNQYADGECAKEYGIDVFLIPSGLNMLRASSLRKILFYAKGEVNRRLIGECIAELFQDPFALCGTGAKIPVATPKVLARCFVAPIVYKYLEVLKAELQRKKYDKVLLGARDGYIFDRIIKEVPSLGLNPDDFVYLYISRVLGFKLGLGNPAVDADYKKYTEFTELNNFANDDDTSNDDEIPYHATKENYKKYLGKIGVDLSGKYLFCDLISSGTVQHSIQNMFLQTLDGFYLGRDYFISERQISYTSVFDKGERQEDQMLNDRLETLIVPSETSVLGMNRKGEFIFDAEQRSEEELSLLKDIQCEIV
ncbi:MAG: hypothetical protein IKN43_08855, partial [Selenomonadaceae bacterium]|nr:hypothetical protein [Selenomonadaceae bacterium]